MVGRARSVLFADEKQGASTPPESPPVAATGGTHTASGRVARRLRHPVALGTVFLGVIAAAAALVAVPRLRPAASLTAQPESATLVVESQPAGWHVWDGDVDRGVTPLTLTLPAGRRTIVLRRGSMTRELQVDLAPGAHVVHHVDLPPPPLTGDLHVETDPAGAIVAVDGIGRGETPLDVRDLKAGRHVVTLLRGDRVLSQHVTIEAGGAASLMVPLSEAAAPAVGWVTVASAIDLEIYEGESLVGSSRNPRLLFMPGRHVLRLANGNFGVEITRTVQVQPGITTSLPIKLPTGSLSVNAMPWAEVLLDGAKIGDTPIANYPAPLGPHEIVLRHPKFGEQRRTIVVSLTAPVRLGADLRR